jgi:predicted dehydrogenase
MTNPKQALPFRVGIIGCGAISNAYFKHLAPFSKYAHIAACADIDVARAEAKAKEHGVAKAYAVKDLLCDPEIDAVLNLTIPAAHAAVNLEAVEAGKHAYCEKPFSMTYQDGRKVLDEAKKKGLRLGCAPDTVLGGGIQTCRKLIDDGVIGTPIAVNANMLSHGVETWHPNPEFYYKVGGGPLFDMGPYYLTSLVTMLGPIKSVSALAATTFKERLITSQPFHGQIIKVETPTHLVGVLEFGNGAVGTVTMSFDVWSHRQPMLEVYGTEGSIQCPDPNTFGGEVQVWTTKTKEWQKVPLTHSDQIGRGVGIADLAAAQNAGRQHRMNGDMALHIVEAMESFHLSADAGRKVVMQSSCERPAALPEGLAVGQLD